MTDSDQGWFKLEYYPPGMDNVSSGEKGMYIVEQAQFNLCYKV